jgi:cell wall-associated NlpC family hydrolase
MPAHGAQAHAQPVVAAPLAAPAPRPAAKLSGLALAQRHARARIRVVNYVRDQRGDWYAHGAEGPSRFDCSGLSLAAYRTVGKRLPHSARQQAGLGRRVSARDARAGDLVAYGTHVGVLVARGRMVDAPGRGRRVLERNIYGSPQYRRVIS